ncbi:MAG: lamin tail domain-containing protein [Candidatus Levybacteria bacterium]|nr:lamin tail domain-containing protein [Candidatus Levybacteria bacterium]
MKQLLALSALFLLSLVKPSFVFAGDVVINEFFSNGSSDWVEIFNKSNNPVDLSLYRLRDGSATNKVDLSGVIDIGDNGFLTFPWGDNLNNAGDVIKLILVSDESIVDQVGYGNAGSDVAAPSINQSAGRQTDGDGSWILFSSVSKGTSNASSQPAPPPTTVPTATLTPTKTPTPTNSPTPSKTPTPTKVPTPTKIPTPTRAQTATKIPTVTKINDAVTLTKNTTSALSKASTTNPTQEDRKVPTAVLGERVSAQMPTEDPTPTGKQETRILGISKNTVSMVFVTLGSLFLLACAILVFFKVDKSKNG